MRSRENKINSKCWGDQLFCFGLNGEYQREVDDKNNKKRQKVKLFFARLFNPSRIAARMRRDWVGWSHFLVLPLATDEFNIDVPRPPDSVADDKLLH